MTLLAAIIIFILGTAIGSFLSVVIYRTKTRKKGILLSRSFCPSCKNKIKWRHLIPILSWLFLRGKCAYCGKKISAHYLMLELFTGLLFLGTFLEWNFIETIPTLVDPEFFNYAVNWKIFQIFVFFLIEFTFLLVIFFYDLMHKEIPDRFSLPAIAIAIAGGLILKIITPLAMLLGGATLFVFFLLQFLISKGTWIGGGDLRLGALMGIILGLNKGLLALIVAYLLGALISIYLLARKKVKGKSQIAFGPFLVIGTLVAIFWGDRILNWYLNTLLI